MVKLISSLGATINDSVEVTSKRIAPVYFFTKKQYMQDYAPSPLVMTEQIDDLRSLQYVSNQTTAEVGEY